MTLTLEQQINEIILKELVKNRFNYSLTALKLDIRRGTIYNRLGARPAAYALAINNNYV